ncbi:hypothetical protein [Sinorhizobium meliloti]
MRRFAIFAAVAALSVLTLRAGSTDAMQKCQAAHSFDACHHALNR